MTTDTTTEKVVLTPELTLDLLRRARDEKGGDYVYRPEQLTEVRNGFKDRDGLCSYFEEDGSPSCIVGHVLAAAGYGPSDITEGETARLVVGRLAYDDETTVDMLQAAQWEQDDGETWSEAVRAAEQVWKRAQQRARV